MKRYSTLFCFLLLSLWANAQEKISLCGNDYPFSIKNVNVNSDLIAKLEWDLTNAPNSNDFEIEVMPIRDCYNAIDGVLFREKITIKIGLDNVQKKDSKDLSVKTLSVKCFKWRIRSTSQNCSDASPWKYYSFLD